VTKTIDRGAHRDAVEVGERSPVIEPAQHGVVVSQHLDVHVLAEVLGVSVAEAPLRSHGADGTIKYGADVFEGRVRHWNSPFGSVNTRQRGQPEA
jgi:hypothetical protein